MARAPYVYAGIDEAGYGPMLGPLCVGCAVFALDDHDPEAGAPDLWTLLEEAVCRRPSDKRRRIAIDDSKTLKGAKGAKSHPLRHLERGVLAFLATIDRADDDAHDADRADPTGHAPPPDCAALLARLHCALPDPARAPWYDGTTPLPLDGSADRHAITGSSLARAMRSNGVHASRLSVQAIDAEAINEACDSHQRKSAANMDAIARAIGGIRAMAGECHPRIAVDRQGGRIRYREELALRFPDDAITVLGETERVARYRLHGPAGTATVSFEQGAEDRHLPVALASMAAKLARELAMARLNAFFARHRPELAPTAGYVEDGRRFLREVAPVIETLRIPRERLVRRV